MYVSLVVTNFVLSFLRLTMAWLCMQAVFVLWGVLLSLPFPPSRISVVTCMWYLLVLIFFSCCKVAVLNVYSLITSISFFILCVWGLKVRLKVHIIVLNYLCDVVSSHKGSESLEYVQHIFGNISVILLFGSDFSVLLCLCWALSCMLGMYTLFFSNRNF